MKFPIAGNVQNEEAIAKIKSQQMGTLSFSAGILLCSTIRDALKEFQFKYNTITFIESSGWIERKFTVKGPRSSLEAIAKYFKKIESLCLK